MRRVLRGAAVLGLVVGAAWGARAAWQRLRPLPSPTAGDVDRGREAFLNSDLGSKEYGFIPRAAYDALPTLCPDRFPEGWAGFGLTLREGQPPVGMVESTVFGLPSYSTNCALCHAGVVLGQVVPGAPAFDFDVVAMFTAIGECLAQPNMSADLIASKASASLGPVEKAALTVWLSEARRRFAKAPPPNPELGPGRSNALNGWKRALGIETHTHVSWVDLPAVFNQALKAKTLYDGSITGDWAARIMLTELQKGRPYRDPLLHREVFDDVVAYMVKGLKPPKYPLAIDAAKAERGRATYDEACADCHGDYAPQKPRYPNRVIPLDRIGTDPERALAMTPELQDVLNATDYRQFLKVEVTNGYIAPALDGVWATAPFLHNGSVPSLAALLTPPEQRPQTFFRRWNGFDADAVGIPCTPTEADGARGCAMEEGQAKHAAATVWKMDTRKTGNSNAGHAFGTDLTDDAKRDLLEYLKTL